jgi:catechol 2,3-dioxygenase-like lactoylglutathione lyase family enzyme
MRVLGIDHVQLAAPPGCEADARRFFGGVLRLEEIEKPEELAHRGGVWFALTGGQQLHVGVHEDFTASARAHPALRVEGLEALAEELVLAAEDVHWDDAIPGVQRFFTEDPWGNRLEFVAAAAT